MGLSADRIRLDADLYEMKTDIGMLSMHRKCLEILPTWMVAKALTQTSYIRTGHRTTTARVLPSRPVRTYVDGPVNASTSFERFGSGQVQSYVRPLDCGASLAAGPYRDARIGSESASRARQLSDTPWFSRSRLIDRFPLPVLRPAHIPGVIRSSAAQTAGAGSR